MMIFINRTVKVKQPIFQIFRKFSALEANDDYYYEFPVEVNGLTPPICPICNKFIDNKNTKCQYMPLPNMCPLEAYNRNKNIIDSLIEELEKKNI